MLSGIKRGPSRTFLLSVAILIFSSSLVSAADNSVLNMFSRMVEIISHAYVLALGAFILLFMLIYAIISAALTKVPVFNENSTLTKQGRLVALSIGLISDIGIFFGVGGLSDPQSLIDRAPEIMGAFGHVAAWVVSIFMAVLVFYLYKDVNTGDPNAKLPKRSQKIGLAILCFGISFWLFGGLMDDSTYRDFGFIFIFIGLIVLLISIFTKTDEERRKEQEILRQGSGGQTPGNGDGSSSAGATPEQGADQSREDIENMENTLRDHISEELNNAKDDLANALNNQDITGPFSEQISSLGDSIGQLGQQIQNIQEANQENDERFRNLEESLEQLKNSDDISDDIKKDVEESESHVKDAEKSYKQYADIDELKNKVEEIWKGVRQIADQYRQQKKSNTMTDSEKIQKWKEFGKGIKDYRQQFYDVVSSIDQGTDEGKALRKKLEKRVLTLNNFLNSIDSSIKDLKRSKTGAKDGADSGNHDVKDSIKESKKLASEINRGARKLGERVELDKRNLRQDNQNIDNILSEFSKVQQDYRLLKQNPEHKVRFGEMKIRLKLMRDDFAKETTKRAVYRRNERREFRKLKELSKELDNMENLTSDIDEHTTMPQLKEKIQHSMSVPLEAKKEIEKMIQFVEGVEVRVKELNSNYEKVSDHWKKILQTILKKKDGKKFAQNTSEFEKVGSEMQALEQDLRKRKKLIYEILKMEEALTTFDAYIEKMIQHLKTYLSDLEKDYDNMYAENETSAGLSVPAGESGDGVSSVETASENVEEQKTESPSENKQQSEEKEELPPGGFLSGKDVSKEKKKTSEQKAPKTDTASDSESAPKKR